MDNDYFIRIINDTQQIITLDDVSAIGTSAFANCSALTTVSFPSCMFIGLSAFNYCSALTKAYFVGSSVPTLNANAFANTPMSVSTYTGTWGSIYVQSSMVAAFQAAANWSAYAARITAYVEE